MSKITVSWFTKYKYSKLASFISSLQGGIMIIAFPFTIVAIVFFPLVFLSITAYLITAFTLPIILAILISKINTDKIAERAKKKYFDKITDNDLERYNQYLQNPKIKESLKKSNSNNISKNI